MKIDLSWFYDTEMSSDVCSASEENIASLHSDFENLNDRFDDFTINIILVNEERITQLNADFRSKKHPTDVITFNYAEPQSEIYVCLEVAQKQALEHRVTLSEEITLLCIHGLLHALGFDHEVSAEDAKQMRELERKLLTKIQLHHVTPLTSTTITNGN